jgi:hypothetical protein
MGRDDARLGCDTWGHHCIEHGCRASNDPAAPYRCHRNCELCRSFVVYIGGLYLVSVTIMGGTEDFASAIVGRILAINATTFIGLLVASQVIAATEQTRRLPYRVTGVI